MPALTSDSFSGSSALFANDQNERRRALSEAYNQMMLAREAQLRRQQQGGQFQQELRQNYMLSDAANQRAALMRSMQLQNQEANLALREQGFNQRAGQLESGQADKKHASRYQAALFEAQNGTFDPSNYQDLPQEERDFFTRQNHALAAPAEADYGRATNIADAANKFSRLQQTVGTPALPTSGRRLLNPLTWFNGTPETIQPSDRAIALRSQLSQAMPQLTDPRAGMVTRDPTSGAYIPAIPRPASMTYVPTLPPPGTEQMGALTAGQGPVSPNSMQGRIDTMTHPLTADRYAGDWVPKNQRDQQQFERDTTNQSFDDWYHQVDALENLYAKQQGAQSVAAGTAKQLDSIPGGTAPLGAPLKGAPTPSAPRRGRPITDKSGKSWLYTGMMDDPTKDRDPDNWVAQ